MAPQTVLSVKQAFIEAQSQLLATTPSPSPAWLEAQAADETALPSRAVEDAIYRLSHVIQQHIRRVHAPQATRHVAEQIDQLYWQAAEQHGGNEAETGVIRQGDDLSATNVIQDLPPSWEDQAAVSQFPAEAQRYAALAERLSSLDVERTTLLARVERLRRMRNSLAPFVPQKKRARHDEAGDEDDQELESVVQENLVTRNSEMERELERMRVLLARVGGRVVDDLLESI
ncbi:hypothetical protein TD95_005062 [Thielaviopsis punctulata]|uniref:Kinetochore protein fta4 n=1 Tax=Thielaviopsis punctulata TaxID=72032 RepID=A0A0F4ZJN2_9PEZI|nr:hypothetical protein TD95_005062 [Thielaviopsis punctulata]